MSARKLAKRACDGCKIRKIKCTEVAPCDGCIAAGIACTFVKHPAIRGPRRLRRNTLQEITQTQQQWEDLALPAPPEPVVHTDLNVESVFAPSKVAALVLQLCVFRLRCYPVWPIIKVERLVASLQKPQPDIEVFALAYAVAAATIAQIRSKPSEHPGGVTAEMMEAQCLYAKSRRDERQSPDLTTVRVPFFLHIYYENIKPGGIQSITCLREAIAVAHMLGLHRESYYPNVEPEEQEIRRRTLWLLFVAERGVSILHKLPVTIKTRIAFPSTNDTDEKEVLLGYQKLITMFWSFDQAGVFELLDSHDFDLSRLPSHDPAQNQALHAVRSQLDHENAENPMMNGVQAVDIIVTRQWMRAIIWRLSERHGIFSHENETTGPLFRDPVGIAKELLTKLAQFSTTAIEAHGPGLETKVFEIACSVVDAIVLDASNSTQNDARYQRMASEVLSETRSLLSRNRKLDAMLSSRIANIKQREGFNENSETAQVFDGTSLMNLEGEGQLEARGFELVESLAVGQSPESESLKSGQAGWSPHKHHSQSPSQQLPTFSPGETLDSYIGQHSGSHSGFNQSRDRDADGDFEVDLVQDLSDIDPSFRTAPIDGRNTYGSLHDTDWSNFDMSHPDPTYIGFTGSVQENSWPRSEMR